MSDDKDSGTGLIPQPRCPKCHQRVLFTAAGVMIHLSPFSRCEGQA